MKKIFKGLIFLFMVLLFVACDTKEEPHADHEEAIPEEEQPLDMDSEDDHAHMEHSSSGDVPEGLKEADNPEFPVGSTAIIEDGHMPGMEGAEATIVGAYDTWVYAVSYTPTTGGERVTNHKWVIHEELADVSEKKVESGTEVVLEADHMTGMMGAVAEIDSVQKTTVYMIDFPLTTTGEMIENHKWVTEGELSHHENH